MHGFGRSEQAEAEQSKATAQRLPPSLAKLPRSMEERKGGTREDDVGRSVGRSVGRARLERNEGSNGTTTDQTSSHFPKQEPVHTVPSPAPGRWQRQLLLALPGGMRRGGGRLRAMHVDERPETETYIERRRSNKTTRYIVGTSFCSFYSTTM